MLDEFAVLTIVTTRLESAGIAYMITGSVAVSLYAEPRMTRDVDLVVELLAAAQLADGGTFGQKLRAMVVLLRHSGLRIQGAACLERARLKDDKLFLYTQKTGTPVNCPLPPETVKALEGALDVVDCISDVAEINALVLHRARASAVIR